MSRRDDSGQVGLLIIGFFLVGVLLVAVVVDASAAYLRRTSMNNLADGAALAAAEGVQGEYIYTSGIDARAPIDADAARQHVLEYLMESGALADYPGLTWRVEQEGEQVRVHVSAPLELPLSVAGLADDTVVGGEAAALVRVY